MNTINVRRFWLKAALAAVVVLAVVSCPELLQACPNCKDALAENDPTRSGLARGFFWSILLMLGTPILITAGLGTYFYLLIRKARLMASAPGPTSPVPTPIPSPANRQRELTGV